MSWDHLAPMGRDQFVQVVYVGYLFPLGHQTVVIKITERKIREATNPVARLYQRWKIIVCRARAHPRRQRPALDARALRDARDAAAAEAGRLAALLAEAPQRPGRDLHGRDRRPRRAPRPRAHADAVPRRLGGPVGERRPRDRHPQALSRGRAREGPRRGPADRVRAERAARRHERRGAQPAPRRDVRGPARRQPALPAAPARGGDRPRDEQAPDAGAADLPRQLPPDVHGERLRGGANAAEPVPAGRRRGAARRSPRSRCRRRCRR